MADPTVATPPTTTPAPTGSDAGPWYNALPEGLRGDASIAKYGSLEDFARSYVNQAKLIGKPADRLVELPTDDAGRTAILRKLGASEDAAAYKLTAPEGVSETLAPTGSLAQMFVKAAHKHSLLPGQAQAVYADIAAELNGALKADEEATALERQEGATALKGEWGQAYDQKVAGVRFVVDHLEAKVPGLKDAFEKHGLENDPLFAKAFDEIGKLFREDTAGAPPKSGGFGTILPPAEAQARGAELLQQAIRSPDMTERRRLNQEASRYFKMAFPEGAA